MATTKVTANVLADNSVTQAKLADDAVGADELAANAVVNASIASGAAIDMDKLDGDSLANTITVNENGYYFIYKSDRYGFNNPDKVWDSKEIDFTQKDLEHMDMFRALIEEENARVSTKWQKAHSNKEQDVASAKVINELEDDPEMVLQA